MTTEEFGTGQRITIHDNKGHAVHNVLDVSDELLGTTMHIVAPEVMTDRWLKYFLYPFQEKDLQDWDLMNNRKKAAYFMQEMLLRKKDDDRMKYMASFYLERICYAYHLLHYDAHLKSMAISCDIDGQDAEELDEIRGIERKDGHR